MRIKSLFTVPKEEKVTEKSLRRVLTASVCSILICMSCLVGSSWAWFTSTLENTGNVIQIGEPAEISVSGNFIPANVDNAGYLLGSGINELTLTVESTADDLGVRHPVYAVLQFHFVGSERSTEVDYAVLLNDDNNFSATIKVSAGEDVAMTVSPSWFQPDIPLLQESNEIQIVGSVTDEAESEETSESETVEASTDLSETATSDTGGSEASESTESPANPSEEKEPDTEKIAVPETTDPSIPESSEPDGTATETDSIGSDEVPASSDNS